MNKEFFIPKAVIFDLDNTLYSYDECHSFAITSLSKEFKSRFNISDKEFYKSYKASKNKINNQLFNTASSHNKLLYLTLMLQEIGLGSETSLSLSLENIYWRSFFQKMKPFNDLEDLLLELRAKKAKLGLLTDMLAHIQYRKINYLGLNNYFDLIVTSEIIGQEKPSKKCFDYLFSYLKIKPEDCWYIGDNAKKDISSAKEYGLGLVIQKIHNRVEKGSPDIFIKSFKELRKKVSLWN